jgi:hypothetical protein
MNYPTLEDLKRPNLPVTIELPNGEGGVTAYQFPLKIPSFFRIQEVMASVIDPVPPLDGAMPYKRENGSVRPQYDYNNPDYLAAKQLKWSERNHRLLLEAWDQEKLPLPGNNDAEKLRYLMYDVDPLIVRQLIEILTEYAMKGRASIDYRASSFRAGRSDDPDGVPEKSLDIELLEKPTG